MKIESVSLTPIEYMERECPLVYKNINKLNLIKHRFQGKYVITPELIKLKKTGNKIVLFSPLLLKIYLIEKDTYEKLIAGEIGKNTQALIDSNLIIPENFNIFPKRDKFIIKVSLTSDCNLKCIYCCYNGGKSKEHIDTDFVKEVIDYVIKNEPEKKPIIYFSGGEPTMEIGKIKEICGYVKSKMKKKSYSFIIASNGLFSEKNDKWLLKNMDSIVISFDGLPEIQNVTRPLKNGNKSSEIVQSKIKRLVQKQKPPKTYSVITRYNVEKQTEIVNYLYRLGIKIMAFLPLKPFGRSINKNLGFNRDIFIENFLRAKEIAEDYGILLKANYLNVNEVLGNSCRIGSSLQLSEGGELINCQFLKDYLLATKSSFDAYSIGYYDKKNKKLVINNKKNAELMSNRNVLTIPECHECFAKWLCGSGCPLKALKDFGDMYKHGRDCYAVKKTLMRYLTFKIEKHFIKITPHLKKENNELHFSMFFNKFNLNVSKNDENIKGSSLVKIKLPCDFEKIYKSIANETRSRRAKTTLFLLSFNFSLDEYRKNLKNIMRFIGKLKKNKIYFKITKPIPKCLLTEKYSKFSEEFNIPKSCLDCLELFMVDGEKIKLCNGEEYYLKNFINRDEIYNQFKKNKTKNNDGKCIFCKYHIRGNCDTICSQYLF
jgi:uncharacterized protein